MRFWDTVMVAATQGGGLAAAVTQFVNGGDFANAGLWTLSTPASSNISGGLLNFTAAAGIRRCYQTSLGTYVLNSFYRISGDGSNYSAGLISARIGADASGLNGTAFTFSVGNPEWPVANGPFSIDIQVTTLTGQFHMVGASSGGQFSIDNLSIVPL